MSGYDTIIIGAGSAGCVLASRLSEQSSRTVLLLEAGADTPPGAEPPDVLDTFASSYYNKAYMWPGLKAHWRRHDNSPATTFDQARIMGGGSSVMGMVALRGMPQDYDDWAASGAQGWAWADVLPYFRKLETDFDFDGPLHGSSGPIPIRRTPESHWPPVSQALAQYARERQIGFVADMNADFRDGHAALPMSNTLTKRGSTAFGYLDASVRARANLTIITGASVAALLFDGRQASGVSAIVGSERKDFAAREVILAAGGVHSPALLLRSGIGPAEELRRHGQEVRADLDGVGRNLQNHPLLFLAAYLKRGARQAISLRPHPVTCFRYSSNLPGAAAHDMYIAAHSKSSWNALGASIANFNATIFKPASRGRVTLDAVATAAPPRVEFDFVGNELDLNRLMDGFCRIVDLVTSDAVRPLCRTVFPVRFTDRIRKINQLNRGNAIKSAAIAGVLDAAPFLSEIVFGRLTGQKIDLPALVRDKDALADYVRANVAGTFHVCGTCRMGRDDDAEAVVDTSGRVRGFGGLRVGDASIMPAIPRGNTNIPTIMVAEKLAAAIRAESDRR